MLKKFSSFICICLTAIVAFSLGGCSLFSTDDEFEYRHIDDDSVAFYRYEGNSSHDQMEVPDEYEGKAVTEISDYAISAAEYLVTIKIGKNVKTISSRAFCGTCKNLKAFEVSADNPYFRSVDGVLFNKDMTVLVAYPNKRAGKGEYVIPEGVVKIADCAFYMCDSLKKVTLASTVEEVCDFAFFKCGGLETVELNEGLKRVGKDGFSFTEGLLELHLPSTIEYIGDYGFYSKTSKLKDTFTTKRRVEEIQCGKGWRPQKTGMENSAIDPVYVGE